MRDSTLSRLPFVRGPRHTILITGGAGGIGRAMSRRFLADGHTVIVCGRDASRLALAAVALPGLRTVVCDVADRSSVAAMAGGLADRYPGLDTVINNAAVTGALDIHDADVVARIDAQVQVNIMGTVEVTHQLLPLLERQSRAWLGIVTSGIAYAPAPDVPGYSLTKAALHSLARSLRYKLRDKGIGVVEIVPPAVDTEMTANLVCKKMTPEAVADRVAGKLWSGSSEIRMGETHLSYRLNRIHPSLADRLIQASFD